MVALDLVGGEIDRPVKRGGGVLGAIEALEQVGAGGMIKMVIVKVELLDNCQCRPGPVELGDRDRTIQGNDGRR